LILLESMGGDQVAPVGVSELNPNLINVIATTALVTLDLRNTEEQKLQHAEGLMADFVTAKACLLQAGHSPGAAKITASKLIHIIE